MCTLLIIEQLLLSFVECIGGCVCGFLPSISCRTQCLICSQHCSEWSLVVELGKGEDGHSLNFASPRSSCGDTSTKRRHIITSSIAWR
ncbi:hypothetical protein EDB89DRAFT_1960251 [Lactarius sanguifluus]|nr:hypothetical protein EDB89DRAFT_1960251 [Lactarius sanguifluus]